MAKIVYTPEGNFSEANNVAATYNGTFNSNVSYTISAPRAQYIVSFNGGASGFEINKVDGSLLNKDDGGVKFDFSDNTAGVTLDSYNYGDVLIGGFGNDTLNGGGGSDVLEGGLGTNTIDGGTGTNTISYEHLVGGNGAVVQLRQNHSFENGGATFDDNFTNIQNVRGSAYADFLSGDTKRNVIEGGGGADDIFGNGGGDFASYLHSAQGVTVDLNLDASAQTSAGDADGDTLYGIDNLYGSTHADTLTGNNSANTIRSFGGADTISGMGGNDRVFISETPTKVDGGDGFDVLNIEAGGTVTLDDDNFAGFERVLVFNSARVDMSDVSASTTTTPTGVSILSRSTSGDTASIYGTKGDDRIYGGAGSDVLRGGAGNDQIHAGEANQTIEGGTGDDLLFASTGSAQDTFNMMVQGFGRDTVRGSADALSNDVFNVDGLGSTLADLTFSKYGNGAIVTGTAGKAGDAVIFSNLTVDQAKGLNFNMDAGQPT